MNFPQGAPASALLRRSEQLVWLFDDVECCLGQLPPEPSPTITGVAAPDRDLPYYRPSRSWIAKHRTKAGNPWHGANWRWPANTCISVDRASVSGWPTDPWCIGSRYHDGIGAVPRAPPNRLGGFPQRRRLVHLQPGAQSGSPVDRDHARRQPPPESRLTGRIDP